MQNPTSDLESLATRVEKLERQNRQARTVCLALVILPVLAVIACQSRPAQVVEAQKFVLRDTNGKVRVEIAMSDTGPNGHPNIRLLDQSGEERTGIGAGVLTISDEKGASAMQLKDTLQFGSDSGVTIRLAGEPEFGGVLSLYGKGHSSYVLLNSGTPGLELADGNGFQVNLGSNELITTRTGEEHKTSAASLVLSGKDGKVLWSAP